MCHHCFGDVAGTMFKPMSVRHSPWNMILPTLLGIGAYWPISAVYTALTTPHTHSILPLTPLASVGKRVKLSFFNILCYFTIIENLQRILSTFLGLTEITEKDKKIIEN